MSYKILSKFIKDVSFEIPNANAFVMLEKDISNYNLNFDISSSKFKNNIIEVNTVLRISPNIEVKNKVMAEINMAALVSIDENLNDKKELEKIILVKVPNEVYETLYETFVYLFSKAGIKNIKIQKEINFEKMYAEREKAS